MSHTNDKYGKYDKMVLCLAVALLLLFAGNGGTQLYGQGLAIGQWRHHLPGNRVIALTETPDRIIAATPYALTIYHKENNEILKFDKVRGLTDFGISSIAYASANDVVVVGYENGNIDIIRNDQVFNIPDIKMSSVIGSKTINQITVVDDIAYLSTDFGIVELGLGRFLINDTYFIGPQGGLLSVYGLVYNGSHFFAATNQGVMMANAQAPNLADFQYWQRQTITGMPNEVFNAIEVFNDKVFVNLTTQQGDFLYLYDRQGWQLFDPLTDYFYYRKLRLRSSGGKLLICTDTWLDLFDENLILVERVQSYHPGDVRAQDAIYDQEQVLWIGDQHYGLVRQLATEAYEKIITPGPPRSSVFSLGSAGRRVWVAPGAKSRNGNNTWNQDGIFTLFDGNWSWFNRTIEPELSNVWDIIRITPNPANPERAYAATWTSGVLEISPKEVIKRHDHTNSTLRRRFEANDHTQIGGVAVDRRGNVWVTNSQVQRPLSVMKPDGQWLSFSGAGLFGTGQIVGNIMIDQSDQKWILLHQGGGIFLFKENNLDSDNDFVARRLTTQQGLPSNEVYSLAVDQSGYVWVGTDKGVAVFYAPNRAFTGEAFQAQQIVVEQDGFGGYLFENETINAITVDGSNKKWFATMRSGAFLLSADGRETIFHFTANNSPLPSNTILDIAIINETGEVFFATDKGVVSFRGLATRGFPTHTDVYAYPNPVRSAYSGHIAINGLITNAHVKITDISGNLVYETIAEGGQAVWSGHDLFGRRPATGVYLVFSTNRDGSDTMVTKIMFIN